VGVSRVQRRRAIVHLSVGLPQNNQQLGFALTLLIKISRQRSGYYWPLYDILHSLSLSLMNLLCVPMICLPSITAGKYTTLPTGDNARIHRLVGKRTLSILCKTMIAEAACQDNQHMTELYPSTEKLLLAQIHWPTTYSALFAAPPQSLIAARLHYQVLPRSYVFQSSSSPRERYVNRLVLRCSNTSVMARNVGDREKVRHGRHPGLLPGIIHLLTQISRI